MAMVGIAFMAGGWVRWVVSGMSSWWRACGWWAVSAFFLLISDILDHDRAMSVWNTLWGAYYLYTWWNGGGGDKTKKRLKKWARKFSPVRRTAPSYVMEVTHGDQDAAAEV